MCFLLSLQCLFYPGAYNSQQSSFLYTHLTHVFVTHTHPRLLIMLHAAIPDGGCCCSCFCCCLQLHHQRSHPCSFSSSWGDDLLEMNMEGIVDGAAVAAAGTGVGNAAARQPSTSTPTPTFTPIVGLPPWHSLFVCWWGITEFGTEMAFSPLFNVGVVLKPA